MNSISPIKKQVYIYSLLLCILFAAACSSDKSKTESTETKTASTSKTKDKTPPAVTAIGQANIFLEVSGSMKGFMPTNKANGITEFQKTIDPFLATIQQSNTIQNKAFFEVREKPYASDYSKISQTVRYGIQQAAASTTIPAILDSIISMHSSDQGVNILISDFIYSPDNGKAVSYVSTDIYRVLSKAKQAGQAVSVFAATSDFDGTFYPAVKSTAQKTLANCCDTPIPYYVWVIGQPEAVRLFNREIIKTTFQEEAHVGFAFEAPAFSVLDKYLPTGSWYCAGGTNCQEVSISDLSTPAEMIVGLNLGNLPAAFASESYLKQNLKLTAENTDVQLTQIYPVAKFRTLPGVAGKNTDPLKPYTHFAKIKLTKLNAPQTEIRFQLANQRPAWVQQWSTADDSQIKTEGAKTFNLAGIMDGVERAFGTGTNGNLVDVAVTLKKEK